MVRILKINLLCVLLLVVTTFANAQTKIGNVYYKIINNTQTVEVCAGEDAYTGAIVIPETVKLTESGSDYQVVAIKDSAFYNATGLELISIPASVKKIGKNAFLGCSILQKVIFASVNDLCGITFANGAANPLANTYAQLYKNSEEALATIEIGNNVSRINAYAFYGIKNITAVYISGNVTSIGNEAFNKCSGFDKVFYADMNHLTSMSYGSSTSNPIVYAGEVWLNNGGSQITEVTISNDVNSYAFRGFKNLTKVYFAGNNVINIGTDAFYDCKNLSEINFPSSLKTIGSNAFHNTKLNSISIPENIISIANEAFTGCTSLENVIIEASLTVLPSRMFDGCTNLQNVTLPKATTTIGNKTFKNCSSLTSLPEGDGLVKFDENAFEGCKGFTELTLPKNIQTIGNYAFKDCTNLTDLFILEPEDETTLTIGSSDWVFSGSKSLKIYSNRTKAPSSSVNPFNGYESIKMYIPEGDTSGYDQSPWKELNPKPYEEHAIHYYVDGEEIYSQPIEVGQPIQTEEDEEFITALQDIKNSRPDWDFAGWDDKIPSLMPDEDLYINGHFEREFISTGSDDLGVKYFLRSDNLKAKVIGYNNPGNNSGVVKINSVVEFEEKSYTIDSIRANAFKGAESLTKIDLSNATTNIGISLFEGCSALAEVTLPAALTEIKEKMFYRCSALSTLVLPENVETIAASAFASCTALSTLVLPEKVKTIGASAFEGCTNYNIDHLPSELQTLGKSAFNSCGIVEMTLPKSITSMGESVFLSCTNLKKVVFNEEMGLSILPAYTFSGCKNLESFTLPTSTTIIGENAFASCSGLKVLALDNVVEISPNAFSSCDNLKTISLPTTINKLGKNAFTYCRNVEMITIESTNPPSVEENTFSDAIYGKAILCVKNADKYKSHDIWKNFENIQPIAASPKLIYKIDDDKVVYEVTCKPGSPVEHQAEPNADFNPKGRAFSGWKDEPDFMPNKDSVIVGYLKYQRIYKAEGTTDELYSDSLFYGDIITIPVNLKKEGLTDSIINPIDTIRADITLFVNYRLTTAPTGKNNIFNNADQDLINYVNLKEGSGTLKYSLDKEKNYSTEVKGKDAKTYKVYYKVDGVTEHYNTAPDSLDVTIAPRSTSVKSITLSQTSYTYDRKAHEPTVTSVTVTVNYNDIVIDPKEYKVSYENNINATSKDSMAQVVITDSLGGNFTLERKTTTFEITPAKGKLDSLLTKKPIGIDSLSYTGEAQYLIKDGMINEEIFNGQLKYSLDNKTFADSIPQGTKAQTYTVYYKVEDDPNYTPSDTASLKVTIQAKEIAISAENITLEKDTFTYDGTAQKPLVTAVKIGETIIPAEEYAVSYTDSINAGTATVTITDKEDGNYKFKSVSKTYTILKAAGKLSELLATEPKPAGDSIVYSNKDLNLINKGTVKKGITGGTLKYSTDSITFDTNIPQGKDAKEYTVYYMVEDALNYTPSDTLSLKVKILPRSTSITTITLSQNSYIYDGTAKEPAVKSVTVKYGGIDIEPQEYKVSYLNNVNVTNKDSKAQVMITDSLGGNFTIDSKTTTFEITPAKGKLDALLTQQPKGFDTLCYNGVAQNLIKAGIINNEISKVGILKYSLDNKTFADAIPQGKEAKEYIIYYKVEGDPNYTPSDTALLKVTIHAQEIAVSADNIILEKDTFTYDGTAQKPLVTAVKIGETIIPATEYTVSYTDNINAGTATVTVTAKKGGNYDFGSVSKKYTILQAAGKLSELLATKPQRAGDNIRYNAEPQNLIKAGTIKKGITGTLKYSTDSITFDTNIPQGTDAKEYTVYYKVEGDPNYTSSETDTLKVSILSRPASVSFTLMENSYTYDGNAKEPGIESISVSFNTSAGSKTINIIEDKKEYKVSYKNNVNATSNKSKAQVIITDSVGGNFSFYEVSKVFEITQAKGRLDALLTQKPIGCESLSYNGVAQNLIKAGTINEEIFNGQLKYSLDNEVFDTAIPQGKEAKEYTIYYKVEDDPNYIPSDTLSLTVTIQAKGISLSADNITLEKDSYTYDGTAKKPGVTVKAGGETIPAEEYIVSYTDNINAGTATVTITEKNGSNYSFGSVSKTFKIMPAASSLTQNPTGKSLTYDGTAQELINKDGKTITGTLEYSLSQDKASFKTTIPTGKDAKTYTVYYRVKGDANHSDSEIGSVKATIAPKDINSFSLSQSSYTYAGSEIKPDVIVEFNKQAISKDEYTVSYSNNKNVGTATVTVTDKEGGNFAVSGSKTFTISKAPLTISADSYEIFEGESLPVFTIKYDGFVNNETEAVLTAKPIVSCNATATSKAGDYTISVGGSKAANYNITHKSGKLTIIAMKFVSGGESSKDEDDAATYQITSTGKDVGTTPTVAIVDDKDVGGAFAIPEAVTYHNTNYKVTEINESAFENNKYLTEVSIPSSITNIGDKAFKGCSNLKSITVYITTPISLAVAGTRGSDGASVFEGVDKLTCVLYVPDGSVDLYKEAPVWSDFKHIVPISTLTGISVVNVTEGEPFDVYNLQGRKVKSMATDLRGLPRGIYIINGKKVAVK